MTETASYLIPATARPLPCRHCGETIYLVAIKDGRKTLAVSTQCGPPRARPPAEGKDGAGISHSLECVARKRK